MPFHECIVVCHFHPLELARNDVSFSGSFISTRGCAGIQLRQHQILFPGWIRFGGMILFSQFVFWDLIIKHFIGGVFIFSQFMFWDLIIKCFIGGDRIHRVNQRRRVISCTGNRCFNFGANRCFRPPDSSTATGSPAVHIRRLLATSPCRSHKTSNSPRINVIWVLKDSFLEADAEGKGYIDCQHVVSVVRRALGIALNNHEREKIVKKAEILAGRGQLSVNAFITVMADTLTETTQWGNLKTDVSGYVGIDTLQDQIRKKVLKKGFEFNIIVVGRSGLGKSTLLNTLFKASVSRRTCVKEGDSDGLYKIPKTTEVKSVSHVLEEKGVRLRLTVTDTPGFGDYINNENCWLPILDYINQQYDKYLNEEQSVARKKYIPDTRVHCCLYFIPPTGHSLTPLDAEFMKRLDKIVNIVPVIAKADTLTVEERTTFKQRIKKDLEKHGINVYPITELEEEPEDVISNNKIREMIPFAVVGSNVQHTVNGRTIYGRKTQWGTVEVENRAHCEFPDLRDMLIRTHMQDLVDVTRLVHYENFRHQKLRSQDHRHLNGAINGQVVDIENMNESSL